MKNEIKNLLENIEKENGVKIIFAVENGSRSWGMASKDSDYDVRFVFYRPVKKYISLSREKDVITAAFDENLSQCPVQGSLIDMSGFDIFKYLKLLYSSNPTTLEWLNSPIVYLGDNNLPIREYMNENFNQTRLFKHYFSLFKNNYKEFIEHGKMITYKKYLYSMRGILNAQYVYNFDKLPPLELRKTIDDLKNLIPEKVYAKLQEVLEIKSQGLERETILRIAEFDEFCINEMNKVFENFNDRTPDIKIFNDFLQNLLFRGTD